MLGERLAFHREDGCAPGGDRGRRMILSGKNVARSPAHICAQLNQRFD